MTALRHCPRHLSLLCLPALLGLCAVSAPPTHAQAAFDGGHSPGLRLSGQGGGTGWASAWSGLGAAVADRKLSDPTGRLPAPPSSVALRAEGGDFLSISRRTAFSYGQPGTTEWVNFVIVRTAANPRATTPPAYGGVALGGSPSLFIGDPGDGHWGMDTSGPPALKGIVDAGPITGDVPTFLVVRADFQAGAARLTLYQDPKPGLPAPNVAGIVKTDLALTPGHSVTLTFGNGSAYAIGALRLGRSYAAVAPAAPVVSKHIRPYSGTGSRTFSSIIATTAHTKGNKMAPTETIEGTLQELLPRLQSLPATERYRLTRLTDAETGGRPFYQTATPEEWGRAWRDWAASHHPQSPGLSDEAVSRDSIYGGRG